MALGLPSESTASAESEQSVLNAVVDCNQTQATWLRTDSANNPFNRLVKPETESGSRATQSNADSPRS